MSEGERLPGQDGDFAIDMERHLVAYRFACERSAGCTVLDAGCGEGYGAAMLAQVAARVVGADRPEAAQVAAVRHQGPRLEFRGLDLGNLDVLAEQFDRVVSFQVIEHLPDPVAFLGGLVERVKPGGQVIVTTPNRLMSVSENPYHLREWTGAELLALAAPVLPGVRLFGVHGSERVVAHERARGEQVQRLLRLDPLGLRHMLPSFVIDRAFMPLARLVRRRLRESGAGFPIGPQDFWVSDTDVDGALDLMLLLADAA